MRNSLVTALVSCADTPLKAKARRFLQGLSSDELQFIAEFMGACILESPERRVRLAEQLAAFQWVRARSTRGGMADRAHKMIVLLEYLNRSGAAATSREPVAESRESETGNRKETCATSGAGASLTERSLLRRAARA